MQDFIQGLPETIRVDPDRSWEIDLVKKREGQVLYFVETRDRLLSFRYIPKGRENPLDFYLVTILYDPGKSEKEVILVSEKGQLLQRYRNEGLNHVIPNDTPEIEKNIDALRKLPDRFQAALDPIYGGARMGWEAAVKLQGELFELYFDRLD